MAARADITQRGLWPQAMESPICRFMTRAVAELVGAVVVERAPGGVKLALRVVERVPGAVELAPGVVERAPAAR